MSETTLIEQLKSVPQKPGVYFWKNSIGDVLYVGKAKQLKNRMRQYLSGTDERVKIPLMMEQVTAFDYIVTSSEHESLILEKNMISQFKPPFNVDYRDDKSYPYIAITKGDTFPAIKYTREKHVATTRYFGPYTNAYAARETIDIARRIVPICAEKCARYRHLRRELENKGMITKLDACFDYHVGLGPGPCSGAITPEEYTQNVKRIERFLAGNRKEFVNIIEDEIDDAAENLDFEVANAKKKQLETLLSLGEKQRAVLSRSIDCDVIGFYREETITGVNVFIIREGAIINSNEFILDKGLDVPTDDLIDTFLIRYYDETEEIPKEIVIPQMPDDSDVLEEWLTARLASVRGAKVHLTAPERGEKFELLNMAERNARHSLMRFKSRTRYDEERINLALIQLESALAMPSAPMRIECYDISTIHGAHSVASMVVFSGGQVSKQDYRHFRIRLKTDEANDVAMMSEVMSRRFSEARLGDKKFGSIPNLIILDGGKPQLNAVLTQLESMGVLAAYPEMVVVGLAKAEEELFVTWSKAPVILPLGSPALYLVKAVRDEAHRFAIEYHRKLRGKAMTKSVLDDIDGVGPKKKTALLKHFGSLKKLRAANTEQIAKVKGINQTLAEEIKAKLS
jgi:excinuclease ABC subunit C